MDFEKPSKIKGFRVSCKGSIPARSTKNREQKCLEALYLLGKMGF